MLTDSFGSSEAVGEQVGHQNASRPVGSRDENPTTRVVIDKHLAVSAARGEDATSAVPYSDDGHDLAGSACAGCSKGNKLSARTAGEVIEVHAGEHSIVTRRDCRADSVNAVRVSRVSVGVCLNGAGG